MLTESEADPDLPDEDPEEPNSEDSDESDEDRQGEGEEEGEQDARPLPGETSGTQVPRFPPRSDT
jgi:hypothetical protein